MLAINPAGLKKLGDMNVIAPGIENLFDADAATSARSVGTTGWAGLTLSAPKKIEKVEITGLASLGFDSSGMAHSITLRLWAKPGVVPPSSRTDGTPLGTISFTDPNAAQIKTIVSSDQATVFDHVWYEHVASGGLARAAEAVFYEKEPQPPVSDFLPISARPMQHSKVIGPANLAINNGAPFIMHVVNSMHIPDIAEGDSFDFLGEFQVTSELPFGTMCSSCLVLARSPTDGNVGNAVAGNPGPGQVIKTNNHNGQNFLASSEHHYTKSRASKWTADQSYPDGLYLNFVVFGASSQAQSGDFITLNSAFVWARHWRPILLS